MKTIAAFSVIAMFAVDMLGPRSSVGGPLASLFVSLLVMLAVGLSFAWSKKFGVPGWLLSIAGALAGGIVGIAVLGTAMDSILELVRFQGRLIDSNWIYPASASMALLAVISAWVPLVLGARLLAKPS